MSVSSVFTGVSMMRSPSGSLPASEPASTRNVIPLGGRVLGAVSLSMTLIQGVAGIDEKYLAATLISSSVIALANPAIWAVLAFLGSEVFLAPLRKSIRSKKGQHGPDGWICE